MNGGVRRSTPVSNQWAETDARHTKWFSSSRKEKKTAGVVEENTEQVTKRNIIASAT